MSQKIFSILKEFQIQDLLGQAKQCQNIQAKWQQFIDSNLAPNKKDKFRQKLQEQQILRSSLSQKCNDPIQEAFQQICPKQICMSTMETININEYKWCDKLIIEIRQFTKRRIQEDINSSSNMNSFLDKSMKFILDILSRRSSLLDYFLEIKMISNQPTSQPLHKLFYKMSFIDFIIMLIKYSQQKKAIGYLLQQQGIPLPIIFQTLKKEIVYQTSILSELLGNRKCPLIFNAGTAKTQNCGKSQLIAKLLSINQKYVDKCSFKNSVNIFSKINFSKQRNFLYADYNGNLQTANKQIYDLVCNLISLSSLIFIHVNQTELMQGILQNPSIYKLLQQAKKAIICVRDWQKYSKKDLILKIPSNLNGKAIIQLFPNFKSTQNMEISCKKLLQRICNQKFNVINEQMFFISKIYAKQHKHGTLDYQVQIQQLINKYLNVYNFRRENILPNVCNHEKLYQLNFKIENFDIPKQEEAEIQKKKLQISKKHQLTSFVTQCLNLIQKNTLCKEILIQKIADWKNSKDQPLRKKFLQLSKSISEKVILDNQLQKLKKQIIQNQQQRLNQEISLDKIVLELILYNKQKKNKNHEQLIYKFYQNSLEEVYPLNIVNGKTLQFGNQSLQCFIKKLSDSYKGKRVHVISVIGAQSSAKSTLLNFLFRCKFQTSAGRCTKGVYMNICEIDNIIVVVLDTEGILSVSARDTAFDHQIATFVLRVSDLIIINNKGQITSTLKDMLQVCLYVMKCLKQGQSSQPQKLIFSLRDHAKPQGLFQEQLLGQLSKELEQMNAKQSLNYRQFLDVSADDILSFPNAFREMQGLIANVGSLNLHYQTFGNCILGMRNRIMKRLKNKNNYNSLQQFYQKAYIDWNSIQKCGKNIMNFKSMNQIEQKKNIEKKYQKLIQDNTVMVHQRFNNGLQNFKKINQWTNLYRQKTQNQLLLIKDNLVIQLYQDFKLKNKKQKNKQWLNSYQPKIRRYCYGFYTTYFGIYQQTVNQKQRNKVQASFETQLNNIMIKILKQNHQVKTTKEAAIKQFMSYAEQEIKKQEDLGKKIQIDEIRSNLQTTLQSIIDSKTIGSQLKTNSIRNCIELQKKLGQNQYSSNQFIKTLVFTNNYQIAQNIRNDIGQIFNSTKTTFINGLSQIIRQNPKFKEADILLHFSQIKALFSNTIEKLKNKFANLNKFYQLLKIESSQITYRDLLFGILHQNVAEIIFQYKQKNFYNQLTQFKTKVDLSKIRLQNLFDSLTEHSKIIAQDIKNFKQKIKKIFVSQFSSQLMQMLTKKTAHLNSQTILNSALLQTFLHPYFEDKTEIYIECYKLVKDLPKYLFHLLCRQPIIMTRYNFISNVYKLEFEKAIKSYKDSIEKLSTYTQYQQSDENLRKAFQEQGMLGTFSLQFANINKKKLLELLIEKMKEDIKSFEWDLQKTFQQNENRFKAQMEDYIKNNLRHKVIGCQALCPFCSMKCSLPKNHIQNHCVSKNGHTLTAFSGKKYSKTKNFLIEVCKSKSMLEKSWSSRQSSVNFPNLKLLVKFWHPDWYADFPQMDQQELFTTKQHQLRLKQIWANIEDAMIITRFNDIKPSSQSYIKQYKETKQYLTPQILQQKFEDPFTKELITLKLY